MTSTTGAVRVREPSPFHLRITATGALARRLCLTAAPADAVETLREVARDDLLEIWGKVPQSTWLKTKVEQRSAWWAAGYDSASVGPA